MTETAALSLAKTSKGERTRAHILETALRLIRDKGYEATTMRAIADAAGLSLGSTYYYFASKEHLIQGYYELSTQEHFAACERLLETESDLGARLGGVLRLRIAISMPFHRFAGGLFKIAADPRSPLNPFSDESGPTRREATALFARVLEGSDVRVPQTLAARLPDLCWLLQMGLVLFWIHDDSPGCDRSFRLVERSTDLVVRLIRLASARVMRPVLSRVVAMLDEFEFGQVPPTPENEIA